MDAGGDRLRHHLEVSELRAARRGLDRRVLLGGDRQPPPAGRHRHQDDPHRPRHAQHHHLQGDLGRSGAEHLSRAGEDAAERAGRAQFHAMRLAADGRQVRRAHLPVRRGEEPVRHRRARGEHLQDQRRPAVLPAVARHRRGGCGQHDRERLLQVGVQGAADGVRGRGLEAAGGQPRRRGRLTLEITHVSSMLSIRNLAVTVEGKKILDGLNLEVGAGEVHAIMGPNGSGKSTLAYVLAGRPGYAITAGEVHYLGRDLLTLAPEERARLGLFLGFQYPVEIPGVNNVYLLKAAVNALRKQQGLPEVDAFDFLTLVRGKMQLMHMEDSFLSRGVNEGFSGGEKKRNEILQMLVLEPKLAVLDETDSGLDIDALKVVANGVNTLRSPDRSVVLVTHYQRLLDYVIPDHVHVLVRGKIARSGDKTLALELERRGYDWLSSEAA